MRLATNFARFPSTFAVGGEVGVAVACTTASEFRRAAPDVDALLVNCDNATLFRLALDKRLGRLRKPLIAIDPVLGPTPPGWRGWLKAVVHRRLFQQVDHYIHYFRNLTGYHNHYGIGPATSSYLPFKTNIDPPLFVADGGDVRQHRGDYVLCIGASYRDFDLFVETVETLPFPAAIPNVSLDFCRRHGSRFERLARPLPANVQMLADDFSPRRLAEILLHAKLVVLPILPENIKASGISLYLNAMRLGRCVIISDGPGVSDVLTDQAVIVPPSDRAALTAAIRTYWEDDDARAAVAERGYRYALSLGGEAELYQRVLTRVDAVLRHQPLPADAHCFVV